ncbi:MULTISPECIES: hypothetical protein [Aeromonas]|uniref:Uncharacterized protein n=1 Tax=Aeromonas hydrophila TaxID=644 RepID=A0AAX3P2W1_AERHY|nr:MULTISPECIES: hypothetical protein [Aeromonas]MCJ7976452.1 hypothetical protein [Aeromonas veronii]UOR19403.1 hypothetical protein LOS88_01495 [Aeromonas veronii]WEE25249.1 hypothetical protein PY771_16515 [Aeromonas hydrophila]
MKIKLSPIRSDEQQLEAVVNGDVISVNNHIFDFSTLTDGKSIDTKQPFFIGPVSRIGGEIHLMLMLSHGNNAPHETRFPDAFTNPITIVNGAVPLPPYDS